MIVSLIKYSYPVLCKVSHGIFGSLFLSSLMYFLFWFCIFHLDFGINSHSLSSFLRETLLFQVWCFFFYFWHILTRKEHNVWHEEPADPYNTVYCFHATCYHVLCMFSSYLQIYFCFLHDTWMSAVALII